MIVYLDVIWALNLLFDTLLLYLTAIFLKRKIRLWRLLSGGFIGSLIILLSFTPIHAFSNHPITKLLFSVLMILATFGYKRLVYFIKALMTLYVSTFLIGGALIGAHYFLQTESILLAGLKGFGDPISWLFVFIGFPIAWHFSKKNVEGMEMTKIQFDQIVSVNLTINSETYAFKGLVDSGNQVYDPLTRLPVMFISIKNQMEVMSEPIKRMAANSETLLMGEEELPSEWQNKLRIIPFRVVGQEHQLIMAVKPDSILIEKNGDCFLCEKGLVSFTMQELSPDDAFQCIVHPKMLTGPRQPGNTEKVS
ncbi:sigma-E processing peptidase SpoIIGA [Bacillus salipaludis]|uniref:Sporulation sigma-E factor-processing peptidase n=1 Tax=Bacillus salipaludis TaxID=2547811 RepID=A0A4R5VZ56_9BACI|nr:sigma-E processing peptidase SpoIIGA [Bacillus salipaludis]MDQ6596879.1 sigma-E processing peptidase SpoIIGA [Bacillus salipaludis]TDK64910.1 sigma-E processing peptidase SpoIIGA [Bacillus salipaludis]